MEQQPVRPLPPRSIAEVGRDWVRWFGAVRLVVSAVAVAAVGAGAFWLLRAPATTVESTLPYATTTIPGPAGTTDGPADTSAATAAIGDTTTTMPQAIVVYVAGAVAVPAVYDLPTASRVTDAIAAAGGLTADADIDVLNLAAAVHDGDRVFVPRRGQSVPAVVSPAGNASTGPADTTPAAPVDLNVASAEALDALPGIGPTTAAAIVAHRDTDGPFLSVDDLLDVRGIGPAKLDAIRDLVTV